MQRYGFFSYHPNVFKRKWEKSNGFPFIWQNWRKRCRVYIILICAREGKFSMIPVWVFLRFESVGLSLSLSKWFGWWFLDKKTGYTPDMFARLRLVWRRPASAYESKFSTRKPDTDRRWWLCVTTSQTYRAINRVISAFYFRPVPVAEGWWALYSHCHVKWKILGTTWKENVPRWGNVLAPLGQAACPKMGQN